MKKAIAFLLGLIVLIPAYTGASAATAPIAPVYRSQTTYVFTYLASPTGLTSNGLTQYAISIYFDQYDYVSGTTTGLGAPTNMVITSTSGPVIGSLTWPAGTANATIYAWLSGPPTANYAITTNPTSYGGIPITQDLVYLPSITI